MLGSVIKHITSPWKTWLSEHNLSFYQCFP